MTYDAALAAYAATYVVLADDCDDAAYAATYAAYAAAYTSAKVGGHYTSYDHTESLASMVKFVHKFCPMPKNKVLDI
jgi:hypothetical protein